MIEKEFIREIVEEELSGNCELFCVEINISPGNEIEVVIDSDTHVDIEDCVALSRAIEKRLDRDTEDFELTVTSAGIGEPLKLLRQYERLIGSEVEVVMKNGRKFLAELTGADREGISVEYAEKINVEGKKRKQEIVRNVRIPFPEIKSTTEYIGFK